MKLNSLSSISPIDGRYRKQTEILAPYFSEFGLIRYRVLIEIEYYIALNQLQLPHFDDLKEGQIKALRKIYTEFSEVDALQIKEIEKTTNHDVKAVEYFIKEKMDLLNLGKSKEYIHFGLTSQDINNTAIPLSIKDAIEREVKPMIVQIGSLLGQMAKQWQNVPMLAKTHGQPASPTRLGKEIQVFEVRLKKQVEQLSQIPFSAKFGGATGNFNAHYVAFPNKDWHTFANNFVNNKLGLDRSFPTTQIEHYDNLASLFDALKRISIILIDFSRDVWQYISMGYFKQKITEGEVGSSAMPHKVNPIDFENAEGNLGIAVALFEHLSAKLPISRLQRDLTDSTVLRNIGVPFGHFVIALRSLEKGIGKMELNESAINRDLEENWAVVAEGIQTVLRRENYPQPYEALKRLTRTNLKIDEESMNAFIDSLNLSSEIKNELKAISPFNYLGK